MSAPGTAWTVGAFGAGLIFAAWSSYFVMIAALARRGHSPGHLFLREHYGVYGRYRSLFAEGAPRWPYLFAFLQIPGALLIAWALWRGHG